MWVWIKILNLFIYILIYFVVIKLKLTWKFIFSFLWKWNKCLLMDQQELNKKSIHKIKSMNEYPFKLHNLLSIYSYMMKKNLFSIFFLVLIFFLSFIWTKKSERRRNKFEIKQKYRNLRPSIRILLNCKSSLKVIKAETLFVIAFLT